MDHENEVVALAPLDELIEILPKIAAAQQRARLGTALQKATTTVERLDDLPARLAGLDALVSASRSKLGDATDVRQILSTIATMARMLAGQPSIEELDHVNQVGLNQLPFHFQRVEEQVEGAWQAAVNEVLGNQGALGHVLLNIPGVESLGRKLIALAARAAALENKLKPAAWRVAELDHLLSERTDIAGRLQDAGIAQNIASFLLAVAAKPVRLSDLTDDILAWLKDHDALEMFDVSARG